MTSNPNSPGKALSSAPGCPSQELPAALPGFTHCCGLCLLSSPHLLLPRVPATRLVWIPVPSAWNTHCLPLGQAEIGETPLHGQLALEAASSIVAGMSRLPALFQSGTYTPTHSQSAGEEPCPGGLWEEADHRPSRGRQGREHHGRGAG